MKKLVYTLSLVLSIALITSFKTTPVNITGTYSSGANNPTGIQLDLRQDHTFTYRDFTDPNNKIEVTGGWEGKGNKVELKYFVSSANVHTKWVISNDGKIAKSAKGLTVYSLVKQPGC